jgi:hypothetical protein
MCRAIAEAHAIDEVKEIRNRMVTMEAYACQALNEEAERQARDIRIRAERRSGQMLKELMAERCSSLIDWPVYPRLRGTMLTTTPKRNPASKSLYLLAAPSTPTRTRQRTRNGPWTALAGSAGG